MRDGAGDQSGENTGCGGPGGVGGSTGDRCFKVALAYSSALQWSNGDRCFKEALAYSSALRRSNAERKFEKHFHTVYSLHSVSV